MKTMKKLWILMAALTADSSSFMARSEDYSNSYNKIAYVNPTGKYAAGSTYNGCYGFTHTFNHDSYAYTATSDDNLSGTCPDCSQTHPHTPMGKLAPMRRVSPFPLWSL